MSAKTDIVPANDLDRLRAVRRFDILDTPPDGAFDRITVLAARLFKVPIAIVSIVDTDRIWFKSRVGVDVDQLDREPGLCASAILQNAPYIVLDAKTDVRTLANPLVAGEFGLRFYAAAQLTTHDGYNLGTLCILGRVPRSFSAEETATLQDLAAVVIDELELRVASMRAVALETRLRHAAMEDKARAEQLANEDGLTGLANRANFMRQVNAEIAKSAATGQTPAVLLLDSDRFKTINDTFGHLAGDRILKETANRIQQCLTPGDVAARLGGDEFIVLIKNASVQRARSRGPAGAGIQPALRNRGSNA